MAHLIEHCEQNAEKVNRRLLAVKKQELARAVIEAALAHCAELGVGVTLKVNSVRAVIVPGLLAYHHPEGH